MADRFEGGGAIRPDGVEQGRRLNNWKEIADFLGVSVRTAHRWESEGAMPVRRASTGHAYAIAEELERWRRGRAPEAAWSWRRAAWTAAGILALVAAVIVVVRVASVGPVASAAMDGEVLKAFDAGGRLRWSAHVPGFFDDQSAGWEVMTPDRALVADVDHDGQTEVVLNIRYRPDSGLPGKIACYSMDGRVRWEHVLGRVIKDTRGEYPQNYVGHVLRLVQAAGKPYVLVVAAHLRWHPCQVALLDPRTGKVVEEFWHPGALTHAVVRDVDGDASNEVLLAGLNNPGSGPGVPVALLLEIPFSRVPVAATSELGAFSTGGPAAYAVMPRADILSAQGGVAAVVQASFDPPATIVIQSRFARNGTTTLTYRFDATLHFQALFMPGEVEGLHGVLFKSGALSHAFDDRERAALEHVRAFNVVPDGNAPDLLADR